MSCRREVAWEVELARATAPARARKWESVRWPIRPQQLQRRRRLGVVQGLVWVLVADGVGAGAVVGGCAMAPAPGLKMALALC